MWEELCGTDSKSNTSVPDDFDSDMICDLFDDDIDNDGVSNDMDAFEKDANETYDFDGDGIGDNADDDDDDDQWLDVDEVACGTDPLNATSAPSENDENCNATKKSKGEVESSSFIANYWWLCLILLLLILLITLLVYRDRGESVLVMMGMQNGPQPLHTYSSPDFLSGSGTKKDPYLLQDIQGLDWGKSASSKETITISHLAPDSIVKFMDMNTEENEGRFDMPFILVGEDDDDDWTSDSDDEESGTTSITFKLKFEDSPESHDGDEYTTLMRVGNSTVYFQWTVTIMEPSSKKKRKVSKKLDPVIEKAESEAKQKAEAEARIKKAEEEARKKAESEVKQKAEAEARIKKAEEEARKKAESEVKQKAEAEARIKKAEEEARKKAESEVRQSAESEAATKLAAMEALIAEKMTALEDKMEGLSKKEAELARVAAKSEFIDFNIIGTATASEKDDLQRTKGIGPFLEEKLNALGIFTFKQIASMTPEIEDQVNIAIEFFRGRVKRDKWVAQAKEFLKEE
jgi:predicted flap endonuclease-1-like 5' DNA nuclease